MDIYNDKGGINKYKLVEDYEENRAENMLKNCFRLNDSLYKFNSKHYELVEPKRYKNLIRNEYKNLGVTLLRDHLNELVGSLEMDIEEINTYDFLEDHNFRAKTPISFSNGTLYITAEGLDFKENYWSPIDKCFTMLCVPYTSDIWDSCGIVDKWFTSKFKGPQLKAIKAFMGDLLVTQSRTESLLYIVGKGGKGKTTLREAIQYLLPPNSYTSLEISEWKGFRMKELIRSPLNFMSEINEKELKNSDMIKKVISREYISYEYKGVDSQVGRPLSKNIAIANDLPNMDLTQSLSRRLHFIHMQDTHIICENFWDEFMKDKKTLVKYFLEGVKILIEENYKLEDFFAKNLGLEAKKDMMDDNNPIAGFINEYLQVGEDENVQGANVYEKYKDWYRACDGNGRKMVSNTKMMHHIKSYYEVLDVEITKKKVSGLSIWCGFCIKEDKRF